MGIFKSDAADGHQRFRYQQPPGLEVLDADFGFGVPFGIGAEKRAERHVIHAFAGRRAELRFGVRRKTEHPSAHHTARQRRRQIVLPHVQPGIEDSREIRAVIHNQLRIRGAAEACNFFELFVTLSGVGRLVPELHEPRASVEQSLNERRRLEAAAGQNLCVCDGVNARLQCDHDSGRNGAAQIAVSSSTWRSCSPFRGAGVTLNKSPEMTNKPVVSLLLAATFVSAQSPAPPLAGFNAATAAKEVELEKQFDATLSRQNMDRWLKDFSSRPHHLGSPGGKIVADKIAALLKSWGYETEIETFYPLFPTPKTRLLEMVSPERYTARLAEPPIEGDTTSTQTDGLPLYNAYSTDGDVTGQLVYVNYGVPADYERLEKMGIDVKGKIVIARYYGSWRGIKPKVAAEHGAIGCLIYSDPKEDGYYNGDTYPKGGYRPAFSGQRGSVLDMPVYPGDPLTPGVGATKDAKRLDQKDAQTITKIPVLPIAYGDAEPLLRALGGPVAPAEWRGALPITYHVGPGTATVHLKLEFDWKLTPAYDVIARLKGAERPGEWIVRGNHHDGWVFGATDPLSGTVEMLEEARGIAELTKQGWRPKRSIVFCVWDGEEPALLGSTEWAEQHATELQQHAAVYINTDVTTRGFVDIGGSHTLELFATQAARDVQDPAYKVSALERKQAAQYARTGTKPAEFTIDPLGSGSDFTPFLQHLGIATLNFGFGGEDDYGVYHSAYDSYDHHVRFEDPDFQYGLTTAQLGGRMVLRLANADVLPLRFENLSKTVAGYVKELTKLVDDEREQTVSYNALAASGALRLAADPRKTSVAAPAKQPVPFINFAPLQNAMAKLQSSVDAWSKTDTSNLDPARAAALDEILMKAEQSLLDEKGLPLRPWYRHMLYAPGLYTGYGVKTLPGIREAIEQRNWPEVETQIGRVSVALRALAAQIDRATSAVK